MDRDEELNRKFQALIEGSGWDQFAALKTPRPNLMRPQLPEMKVFRVRALLDDSVPQIWRTLDMRSDLTLDMVHSLMQGAFGWDNTHLHRFSLGGGPFDLNSQLFLCPFDVEEGEDEGLAGEDVRLDQLMQEPGDELRYVYDYGDSWEITLRLEQVREPVADTPVGVCVDGRRAAPPEDCGGITRGEDLAKVLPDPAYFDLETINRALVDPFLILRRAGLDIAARDVLLRMRGHYVSYELFDDALRLLEPVPEIGLEEFLASLRPVLWFLAAGQGEGIPLTQAGYLKPADVIEASAVVPVEWGWPGRPGREINSPGLLHFRESLQKVGLLRKRSGRLVLTKAGQEGLAEPQKLWGHLASRLIPEKPGFERDAAAVALLMAAVSPSEDLSHARISSVIEALGWRFDDGSPVGYYDVRWESPVLGILMNVATRVKGKQPDISPVAAALAHEALFWQARGNGGLG